MNCTQARDIIHAVLDGDDHPLYRDAQEHMDSCRGCREWHSGMVGVLGCIESASETPVPDLDLAGVIMSRLPERHPASIRQPMHLRLVKWAMAGIGACWLVGAILLAFLGMAAMHWLGGQSGAGAVVQVYDVTTTMVTVLAGFAKTAAVLAETARRMVSDLGFSSAFGVGTIVRFILLDSAVLAALAFVLFRRRSTRGTLSILV